MLATYVTADTRQNIINTYDCTNGVINNISSYSSELSNLYEQNPFISLASGTNSSYDVTINSTNLANYLNATPNTQFYKDLIACIDSDDTSSVSSSEPSVTTEDIDRIVSYLPQISAKFEGFLDHRLTELTINAQNNHYTLSANLNFAYPDSINATAPTDSHPIMDVIEEVYTKAQALQFINLTIYPL